MTSTPRTAQTPVGWLRVPVIEIIVCSKTSEIAILIKVFFGVGCLREANAFALFLNDIRTAAILRHLRGPLQSLQERPPGAIITRITFFEISQCRQ